MAVGGQSEVIISKAGIFEYSSREQQAIISNRPVSVGDAVRASSAIPGVFEAIAINGRMLFDGALGKFGKCPTDIAVKHLGVPKDHIIASLPAGAMTTTNKALYYIAKFLSGSFDRNQSKIVEEAGVVIRPRVDSFGSLKLNIDQAQREEAIMAGYRSAVEEFARARIVTGPKLEELREAGRSFQALQEAVKPGRFYPPMVIEQPPAIAASI